MRSQSITPNLLCAYCEQPFSRKRIIASTRYCSKRCANLDRPKIPPATRFWQMVNQHGDTPPHCPELGPCWLWTGNKSTKGYGQFSAERRSIRAHRFSWELHGGMIPEGLKVLHKCDNPPCVRFDHLFLGTTKDNTQDMLAKGRANKVTGKNHWMNKYPERRPYGDRNPMHLHPERIARGEERPGAKLTEIAVQEIRSRYAAGGITQKALAQEFNVHVMLINGVVNRKMWTHVS